MTKTLNYREQIAARMAELDTREGELATELETFSQRSAADIPAADAAAAAAQVAELRGVKAERAELEARDLELARIEESRAVARPPAGTAPAFLRGGADPGSFGLDVTRASAEQIRDAARRGLDSLHTAGRVNDAAAEVVTGALTPREDERSTRDAEGVARWLLATGSPEYRSAFAKVMSRGVQAPLAMSDAERAAFARADDEARALSIGGSAGALVPAELDPAIQIANAGSIGAIAKLARRVVTTSKTWTPFRTGGVTAAWGAEASEVVESTPVYTPSPITPQRLTSYVKASFEAWDDIDALADELGREFADAVAVQLGATFATGSGTGSTPQGIVTGLLAADSDVPTAAAALAAADVRGLLEAVPARYRDAAQFVASLSALNAAAELETANGSPAFPNVDSGVLLRRTVAEDSHLGSVATAGAALMIAGDFERAYAVVTRVGSRIEPVANAMGANGLPTAERGLLLYARVGAGITNPDACRVLVRAA